MSVLRTSLIVVLIATAASAETQRVAVLVANNAGSGDRPALHYAETDAGKMARVLVELGRVDPSNLFLLQGRPLTAVREVFAQAKQKVTALHREPDSRVVLIFYFSGHSDGEVLEVGRDRLPFSELRQWLTQVGADVRVGIIDSCKSGALLASKGGAPGPAFQVRLIDDLSSSGEALLTSSAADEVALESTEIRGSFFTHHLVSGLRGAADTSGDGRVTLAEAYEYAFSHTVTATAGTVGGSQHPVYDYRLAGQGELVLTELSRPSASLELPSGYDRVLVVQLLRDQVIAELTLGAALHLAVPAGDYALRAWRNGQAFSGKISVKEGETLIIRSEALFSISSLPLQDKGGDPPFVAQTVPASRVGRPTLLVAFGAQPGIADGLGPLLSGHLALHFGEISGPSVMTNVGWGRGSTPGTDGFTELSTLGFVGYRWGLERGRLRLSLGPEVGAGIVSQISTPNPIAMTWAVAFGPYLNASVRLTPQVYLTLETHLPLTFLRRDRQTVGLLLPAGWLGLAFPL